MYSFSKGILRSMKSTYKNCQTACYSSKQMCRPRRFAKSLSYNLLNMLLPMLKTHQLNTVVCEWSRTMFSHDHGQVVITEEFFVSNEEKKSLFTYAKSTYLQNLSKSSKYCLLKILTLTIRLQFIDQ